MQALMALLLSLAPLAGSPSELTLPRELKDYPHWKRLSPPGYSVPASLATACIAPDLRVQFHVPDPPPSALTLVDVYATPLAEEHISSKQGFPEGAIIIKNKHAAMVRVGASAGGSKAGEDIVKMQTLGEGVMIKGRKGSSSATGDWKFFYYPSVAGASFSKCVECHKSASHDFVFARYLPNSP